MRTARPPSSAAPAAHPDPRSAAAPPRGGRPPAFGAADYQVPQGGHRRRDDRGVRTQGGHDGGVRQLTRMQWDLFGRHVSRSVPVMPGRVHVLGAGFSRAISDELPNDWVACLML
jgi:hypothetical protein